MIFAALAGVLMSQIVPTVQSIPPLEDCLAEAVGPQAMFACFAQFGGGSGGNPAPNPGGPSPTPEPGDLTTYRYLWLPTCPGALPQVPGAVEMTCAGLTTCADPALVRLTLYAQQLTDGNGQKIRVGWTSLGTECRDPADLGPVKQQRRQLAWTDVLSAVRRVGIPAEQVEAPQYTLVNLDTTFYTTPAPIDRSLTIIGYAVDVHIEPTTYTWNWGDGSSDTTTTPGQPYPNTDVTHTYVHATREGPSNQLSVDVTYTIRYRVDGGEWLEVPETITIPGESTGLPIKQAAAVLVAED